MVIESEENVEKAKAMVAELTAKYPLVNKILYPQTAFRVSVM